MPNFMIATRIEKLTGLLRASGRSASICFKKKIYPWVKALYLAIHQEGLDYRATSLAYTTLLSVVPILAFCFSLLRTFGVNRYLEPFLIQILQPLGEKGPQLTSKILDFVTRVNVGVLGFMGLVVLIYLVLSMLLKVEKALNHIWRVNHPRGFAARIGNYLSVLLLGPVLVFSAIGLSNSVPVIIFIKKISSYEPFGSLFYVFSALLSLGLVILAFSLVYFFIPHTRVPWRSALVGGTVAGILWKLAGTFFADFVTSSASYHAIYSSLVIVVLFMIWLELFWLILLLGGQAAMYAQHPYYIQGVGRFSDLGYRTRTGLGLTLMLEIVERFIHQKPPWSSNELAARLALPWDMTKEILLRLKGAGLLEETGRPDESYVPASDIAGIKILQVVDAMNEDAKEEGFSSEMLKIRQFPDGVVSLLERQALSFSELPELQRSLKDFFGADDSELDDTH